MNMNHGRLVRYLVMSPAHCCTGIMHSFASDLLSNTSNFHGVVGRLQFCGGEQRGRGRGGGNGSQKKVNC